MNETLRVLIVDDESTMRLAARRALSDFTIAVPEVDVTASMEFDEAVTGEEALERLERGSYDLMLLDLKLPGMSGMDVLERLVQNRSGVLTIMITAYASIQTAVEATKQGAHDFLAKPYTLEELRNTVRKAVRHRVVERQARRLAEEKHHVRFEFISVLAHELKAPIAAVEGYMNMMESDFVLKDPAVFKKILTRSRLRLEGMRKIIVDLLDMTRIESGRKKREFTTFNLVEAARMSIDGAAAAAAKEKNITIRLHAPESAVFTADRGEIDIILNNLISNAIKYNRTGGSVDVTLKVENGKAVIEVRDTGIGMTKEEASRLFQDFVRIKNPKTKDVLGSGLGLSIVRKLAELYDGSAVVESEPDKGSAFTVSLREINAETLRQPRTAS